MMRIKNDLAYTHMESYTIEKTDTHASMNDGRNMLEDAAQVHHGRKRPPPPQDAASIPAHKKANRNDDDDTNQSPKQSERRSPKQGVWVPDHEIRPTDVLCGRHRASRDHAGNKYFRQIIGANRAIYTSTTSRSKKTRIATQLVSQVVQAPRGGRFLKLNEATNRWHQVDHTYAHDKVSHALRSAKDWTNPRPRKKRRVAFIPPTDQEEALFRALYADQQQFFSSMTMDDRSEEEEPKTKAGAKIEAKLPESIALEPKVDTEEDATLANPPMDFDAFHSWLNSP
jgi:hypothetical protein